MRLRGLVFERFVTFDRAELNLCGPDGVPLDVVLVVGESGVGKTALLRGLSGVLSEAALAGSELDHGYVRRGASDARCRVVFDDAVGGENVIVALEKELRADRVELPLRAARPDVFESWRRTLANDRAPRAAFSIETPPEDAEHAPPPRGDDSDGGDGSAPLLEWLFGVRGTPAWDAAIAALEHVLWPYRVEQVSAEGELVFAGPSGLVTASELGDGFESVLVMALELVRMVAERPDEPLVYVIDDIDAHLHPRWQARIVGDLRRAFPRVQIVATTHSPYVVASVEPHQVFRVDAARQDGPATISRIADRLRDGQPVAPVMELAFGAPHLPGPRWARSPSQEVREAVLRALAPDLARGAVVYVHPEPVYSREVRNSFGELALPGLLGASGHVFFVDFTPGVPWEHPCEYVFRANDGTVTRQRGAWPPANIDRFVAVGGG